MLSQQLTLQCPSCPRPFRRNAWKGPYCPSALPTVSYTVVSSSGAEVAKRRAGPTSRYIVESLSASREPPAPKDTDAASKFLEVYILGKHIGSGAYGQVQLVVERASGKCAAVKLLPKTRGKLSKEKTMKKIRKEVDIMGTIQECSNVIGLHGVYEDDYQVYVVMELCNGGDLERVLEERGPFSELQTALVLYECLKVIASCHAKSIVHGDVKPANFMLKQRFRDPLRALERGAPQGSWLKAVDFGCSQSFRNKASLSRRTGTPVYMAPEVFKRDYLQASDMWSLGMMMYQLLTGRFPFWDTLEQCRAHGIDEVMRAAIMDPIPINYGPWLSMSEQGLSFLQCLMLRNPAQRITAADALEHPWFAEQFAAAGLVPNPSCSRLEAAAEAGESTSSDHRNNIVPMPQQQQQHQSQQSHNSSQSKQYVLSL